MTYSRNDLQSGYEMVNPTLRKFEILTQSTTISNDKLPIE